MKLIVFDWDCWMASTGRGLHDISLQMIWKFDQAPNVACITCQSVIDGHPVLVATHYEDDHSWAFTDGAETDVAMARVVAMSEVVERHPELDEIASLPPGWSAIRAAAGEPWMRQKDPWSADAQP